MFPAAEVCDCEHPVLIKRSASATGALQLSPLHCCTYLDFRGEEK